MKPTIAIGDIHGLEYWKTVVEEHENCRFVFLGDYLDPYEYIKRKVLLANLQAITDFKKAHPDDVILLLGNHDLHYFNEANMPCSRFDFQIAERAAAFFQEYTTLFQNAYQEEDKIFTHAGISQKWFDEDFRGDITLPIAEQLNHPKEDQLEALYRVGRARGGRRDATGGIFWADSRELAEPLKGFTQIVGHNRVENITERTGTNGGKIIFCDCLRYHHYLRLGE